MNTKKETGLNADRTRTITYRISTAIVIAGMLLGGASQLIPLDYQVNVFTFLGYPLYLLIIIGVLKIAGAIVILLPRLPVLKTWAYAGLFFVTTSAFISHMVQGDIANAFSPLIVAVITMISYRVNPNVSLASAEESGKDTPMKKFSYWTIIVLLEFVLLSGGMGQIFHLWGTVEGTVHTLGYPMYFLTIIGAWKILAAIALLSRGFPRIQEWAYAGIFFEMLGAVVSHAMSGSGGHHLIIPLILAGLVITARALRPREEKVLKHALSWHE